MVLPLQGDFNKLKEEDQVRFKNNLTNKIKYILKDCVKLVENYFEGLISNWKQAKETHGQNAALFQAHAFSS